MANKWALLGSEWRGSGHSQCTRERRKTSELISHRGEFLRTIHAKLGALSRTSKSEKKSLSIVRMLPILTRRVAKPRVFFAALSRCVVSFNYSGVCCGQQNRKKIVDMLLPAPWLIDRYNNKQAGAFLGYLLEDNA